LIQYIPKYEELGIPDLKEHDPRAFALFLKEAKQDVRKIPHVSFSGQLQKGKKEGKGGFKFDNGDFYYGMW